MPSKKTEARLGVKAAMVMARHPMLRRETVRVGKVIAKRKVRGRAERIGAAGSTLSEAWVLYGLPMAQAWGLVERPKPRHRGRAFAAGAASGAVVSYVLLRGLRD
jgi:hypothetical protein